jgi:hypothetical protein
VPLAKSLRREIAGLGKRLENAAIAEEDAVDGGRRAQMSEARHAELLLIIGHIKDLLGRIDRDIPLLQLAITASGEKMSTNMTPGISPSRMMQASALLSFADAHFVMDPSRPMQVGPSFTLSLYMLFLGHAQARPGAGTRDNSLLTPAGSEDDSPTDSPYGLGEGERRPIWQEVMHKSRVRLCRTPVNWVFDPTQGYRPGGVHGTQPAGSVPLLEPSDGYAYHLEIIEDLDDGRVHDGDDSRPRAFDNVRMAGIRESIPIHQISKIFYTDTGRILNIGSNDERDNNPVLLLKRDINAQSPITIRQEWFGEPGGDEEEEEQEDEEAVNESQPDTADESSCSDEQDDVDRQLWQETEHATEPPGSQDGHHRSQLPPHLDPEWLALEVYTEDDGDDDEDEEEAGPDDPSTQGSPRRALVGSPPTARSKLSVDSRLVAQMRHISLRAGSPPLDLGDQASADLLGSQEEAANSYVRKSPFGSIASSLSLLEMVIRLTSLQEFQQTSHLAIPDHILMFFLEETSTTGLQGEEHWRMRREAKRRMGFDPYTDGLAREDRELSR